MDFIVFLFPFKPTLYAPSNKKPFLGSRGKPSCLDLPTADSVSFQIAGFGKNPFGGGNRNEDLAVFNLEVKIPGRKMVTASTSHFPSSVPISSGSNLLVSLRDRHLP